MLYEADVIEAVCGELKMRGYEIRQTCGPKKRGDDIIAVRKATPCLELFVEAKGETSSGEGTKLYGEPFDRRQVRSHVAKALFKSAQVLSRDPQATLIRVGIALPDTETHRSIAKSIRPVLERLSVAVFWVRCDRTVELTSPWPL